MQPRVTTSARMPRGLCLVASAGGQISADAARNHHCGAVAPEYRPIKDERGSRNRVRSAGDDGFQCIDFVDAVNAGKAQGTP